MEREAGIDALSFQCLRNAFVDFQTLSMLLFFFLLHGATRPKKIKHARGRRRAIVERTREVCARARERERKKEPHATAAALLTFCSPKKKQNKTKLRLLAPAPPRRPASPPPGRGILAPPDRRRRARPGLGVRRGADRSRGREAGPSSPPSTNRSVVAAVVSVPGASSASLSLPPSVRGRLGGGAAMVCTEKRGE